MTSPHFTIRYSAERGYEERALALARRLFAVHDEAIDSLALLPVADDNAPDLPPLVACLGGQESTAETSPGPDWARGDTACGADPASREEGRVPGPAFSVCPGRAPEAHGCPDR